MVVIVFHNLSSTTGVSKFSIPEIGILKYGIPIIDIPEKTNVYRHLKEVYQNLVY